MKRRPRRPAHSAAPASAAGGSRHRALLWLGGLLVLVAILATVYLWPYREDAAAAAPRPAGPPLVLPTQPEARTVDQLREEAETVVAAFMERFPQAPGAHKAAAMLNQFLNQYETASGHWKSAIDLDPRDSMSRAQLAKLRMKQGDDAAALEVLQAAQAAGLDSAEIQRMYAAALQRQGQLAESKRIASQALQSYPNDLQLWIVLGQSQLQLGLLDDAKKSLDAALRIDPNSGEAHYAAASVALRLGHHEAAAAHRQTLEQAQAVRRRDELPFDESYEQSLRNMIAALFSTAAMEYDELGQSAEAERLCRRAFAIQPDAADPYRQLGNMLHHDGKLPLAIPVLQRLAEVEPENEVNHLNLASLLFEARRMEQGETVLLNAARAWPQKAIFPETLATVYLRSGQPKKARHFIEQAIRLEPLPQRHQFLADVCRRMGDLPAADAAAQAGNRLIPGPSP